MSCERTMVFTCKFINNVLRVTTLNEGRVRKMRFLTNLNAINCYHTPICETLIYCPTNSCKLQKYLSSSKSRSLKSTLLGKTHALLQGILSENFHFLVDNKQIILILNRRYARTVHSYKT